MTHLVNFTKLVVILLNLFSYLHVSNSVKINEDGGYEISIALDEASPIPTVGVARYVDNIKIAMRAFSNQMWIATRSHFYVKSVDLLIPSHWNDQSSQTATTQSYEVADIRLSPKVTYPHAENPNVCGQPGNFINLPEYFFNVTTSGPYGLHWKSLLHVWALYRFGVHSEHGYIDHPKYPYAQKDLHSQQWKVTGCSNGDVKGRFIDIVNPDDSCEAGESLPSTCRFVPDSFGQNVSSSLMHFHWIESVTEFCDEHTHDKYSRNKQNDLCDHRSVWEVIRESPDFMAVKAPRNIPIPPLTFRTVKHSSQPLFYLLLDRGLIQGPSSVAVKVPPFLATLFTNPALQETLASIGAYPGNESDKIVSDLVDWSEIGQNSRAFLDALGSLTIERPLERDFSRALVEVANKIKEKSHSKGAVVLLMNYGADVKSFGSYLPESEVLHAFNEGNIIFNAIELSMINHTEHSHLANVARGTGGSYTVLRNYGEIEMNVKSVVNYVSKTLTGDYSDLNKSWKLLRKESLTVSSIPIPNDLTGSLQAFVSSRNADLTSENFKILGIIGGGQRDLKFTMTKTADWNEEGSKLTYSLNVPKSELNGTSQVNIRLVCNAGDCFSTILVRAEFSPSTNNLKIQVGASALNNQADLSSSKPIAVFAKVTKNDSPVQDALVTATFTDALSTRASTVRLVDNGEGADSEQLDGIYSAHFAPELDGEYKVTVTVRGNPSRRKRSITRRRVDESVIIQLLPVDQGDIGCQSNSCDLEVIDESVSQTVEMALPITVSNASLYKPTPSKIVTLAAFDRPDLGQVTLFWVTPSIPGRLNTGVSSYILRSAPTLELLITDFDNQTNIPIPPNFRPKPPVNMETLIITRPTSIQYYAIRSVYQGKQSPLSNIVQVIVSEATTTTTTSPPSTPSSPGSTESTSITTTPPGETTPTVPVTTTPPGETTPTVPVTTTPPITTPPGGSTPTTTPPAPSTGRSSSEPTGETSPDPEATTDAGSNTAASLFITFIIFALNYLP